MRRSEKFDQTVTELTLEFEGAIDQAIDDYLEDQFPNSRHPTIGSRAVAVALTRITERWLRKPAAVAADVADVMAAVNTAAAPAARGPAATRGHWVCICTVSPEGCTRTSDGPDGMCEGCRRVHKLPDPIGVVLAAGTATEISRSDFVHGPPVFELTPEQAQIFLITLHKYPQWNHLRDEIARWLGRDDVKRALAADPQQEPQDSTVHQAIAKAEMEEGR